MPHFHLCHEKSLVGSPSENVLFVEVAPNANPPNESSLEHSAFWKELERLTDYGGIVEASTAREWLICETFPGTGNHLGIRIRSSPVTRALREVLGESATIIVRIRDFRSSSAPNLSFSGNSKVSKIQTGQHYAFEEADMLSGFDYGSPHGYPRGVSYVTGTVTIGVWWEEPDTYVEPRIAGKTQVYKRMLDEGIQSDLIIIPQNGVELKAHKAVLAAQSDVLSAMFETDMKEAKTHILEVPDMSEATVRALLAYLYYLDETEPNTKPLVAFEMLCAGHKYNIPVLETDMKAVILAKASNWLVVDVAVKLFLFARNLPEDGECLKKKTVKALKRNFASLNESPTYATLFKEDPKAAMELCSCAFAPSN